MRRWVRVCFVAVCCVAANLSAQDAKYVYQDRDPAASYLVTPPGGRARFKAAIEASLRKNPKNSAALTHRAYYFNDTGDTQRALRDFDAALAASDVASVQARHVYWSRGWARYDNGEVAAAIADWREAARLHGGSPYWLPYTLALGYWTMGERDEALRWFDIAVTSQPVFATDEGIREKIRNWDERQQENMMALHQAWKAR